MTRSEASETNARPPNSDRGRSRRARLAKALSYVLLGLAAATSSGCFIEIARPSQFRYSCDIDDDCPSGESCIGTLCQVPCSTATASEACPSDAGYVGCFNGGCASLCNVGDDVCPAPQTCIGLGGDTGGPSDSGDTSSVGLCGAPCSPDVPTSCPAGETCVMGACVLTCVDTDPAPCPDGLTCTFGVCVSAELPFAGSVPVEAGPRSTLAIEVGP